MNNILWAFNFQGLFKSASIVEVNEETKMVFVKLERSEKKAFVVLAAQNIIDSMIAKLKKSGTYQWLTTRRFYAVRFVELNAPNAIK